MSSKRLARRRAGGFTLLEVLLVVGLLALMAAFVLPNLFSASDRAKKDLARAAVGPSGTLSQQVQRFYFDTSRWPESLNDLNENPGGDVEEKWSGPYIEDPQGLKDPWDNEYKYAGGSEATHNRNKFDLWSMGPDGQDGTDDDITSWTKE